MYFHTATVRISVTAVPWAAHLCSLSSTLRGAPWEHVSQSQNQALTYVWCLISYLLQRDFCSHPATCQSEPAFRHSVSRPTFPQGEAIHVGRSASPQNEPLLMGHLFLPVCPLSCLCEPGDNQRLVLGQERARPSQAHTASAARPRRTLTLPLEGRK